jgi:hypothetical protein
MAKSFFSSLVVAYICILTMGCGDSGGTKSVFDEEEMAQYRSTPEQISSSGQPTAEDMKKMQQAAMETAKAAKAAASGN